MGISPTYKTSVPIAPTWTIQLVPDSGAFSVAGLTAASFSLLIHNLDTGAETTGIGTFSNVTAAVTVGGVTTPASVQYQVASSEVVIGRYRLFVLVTLSGGGIEPFKLMEDWEVIAL